MAVMIVLLDKDAFSFDNPDGGLIIADLRHFSFWSLYMAFAFAMSNFDVFL